MTSVEYTVKVYADAVERGLRTLESVPDEFRKEVEEKIRERENGINAKSV